MPLSHLPGHIHTAPADQIYDDLAHSLMAAATEAVEKRGVFHLALSGGSTPEPFFVRLVIDPRFRLIPWPQTEIWQVDERIVPDDDPRRNLKMIRETLTDHLPIYSRQLHGMPVQESDPAAAYEAELRAAAGEGQSPMPLDFVLLGLGSDGHTASLFPGSPALTETQRWIVCNDGPQVTPPPRLTMTFPLLNAARRLAVLATGAGKASILRQISDHLRASGPDPQRLPITGIQPHHGQLSWWLNTAAARNPTPGAV